MIKRARFRCLAHLLLSISALSMGCSDSPEPQRLEEVRASKDRVLVRAPRSLARIADAVSVRLSSALEFLEGNLPYRLPEGDGLVFHLYENRAAFEARLLEAGSPALARNRSATLNATRESHILVEPRTELTYLSLVGEVPRQTLSSVYFHALFQFVRRAGAQNSHLWPGWYVDGLAEYVSALLSREPAAASIARARSQTPRIDRLALEPADSDLRRLPRLLYAHQVNFSDRRLLAAYAGSLMGFLAQDAGRLQVLHEHVKRDSALAPPLWTSQADVCTAALTAAYGPLSEIEAAWQASLATSAGEFAPLFEGAQDVADEIVCAAAPSQNCAVIAAAPPRREKYSVECEVNILGVGTGQAELYLSFQDSPSTGPRFVKIALGQRGYVTMLAFSDGFWQEQWRVNAEVPRATFGQGRWVQVSCLVDRGRLVVVVGERQVLQAELPKGFAMSGRWGVGCFDEVARFRRIRCVE